jgi:putative transposase
MAERSMDGMAAALQEVFRRPDGPRAVLELLANLAMREEVAAHVGAAPHERSDARRGRRNGTKARALNTRVGPLALDVPQVRGCEPYHPTLFARWQRSERALLVACGR